VPCGNAIRIKHKLAIGIFLTGEAVPSSIEAYAAAQQMQRTINALVGLGGRGGKETAEVGNPVEGMGEAIIPSLLTLETEKQPGAAEARKIAEAAAEYAIKAIAMPNLPEIQRWGKVVYYLLRAALEAIDP
jgi:hypothetical protein